MLNINTVRTAMVFAAAFGLAAAQPAFAEDEPKAAANARPAVAPYSVSDDTRICVRETLTGSRVPRKVCNTLKGWKSQGVDPFNPGR